MPTPDKTYPTQHIGGTVLVVMMEVDPAHEDEFNHWYDDEHLPERLEIPGYVSARRFKLEEGEGVLRYLCIWELEDGNPLRSEAYKAQQQRPVSCGTASIRILLNGCAASTSRFTHQSEV